MSLQTARSCCLSRSPRRSPCRLRPERHAREDRSATGTHRHRLRGRRGAFLLGGRERPAAGLLGGPVPRDRRGHRRATQDRGPEDPLGAADGAEPARSGAREARRPRVQHDDLDAVAPVARGLQPDHLRRRRQHRHAGRTPPSAASPISPASASRCWRGTTTEKVLRAGAGARAGEGRGRHHRLARRGRADGRPGQGRRLRLGPHHADRRHGRQPRTAPASGCSTRTFRSSPTRSRCRATTTTSGWR